MSDRGGLPSCALSVDYSAAGLAASHWRPHDLVWLHAHEHALPSDVAPWARAAVASGQPLVVRRARRDGRRLPLGIRGPARSQRQATTVLLGAIERHVTPEMLAGQCLERLQRLDRRRAVSIPALSSLAPMHAMLDSRGWLWGIVGAVGFELATGLPIVRPTSDIDLLLRTPAVPDRHLLSALHSALDTLPVRCDVQLETPAGGVALADWLSGASEVLVKSDQGPYLSADPWAAQDLAMPAGAV